MLSVSGFNITMICVWLVLAILLIYIEVNTAQMVSLWFAAGSLIALILAAFDVSFNVQLIVFASVALVFVIATRPIVKKINKAKHEAIGIEALIGQEVLVTKDILTNEIGEVKSRYERYNAISLNNEPFLVGSKVIVKEIIGNKVVVDKI